jgi:hypothetical protein
LLIHRWFGLTPGPAERLQTLLNESCCLEKKKGLPHSLAANLRGRSSQAHRSSFRYKVSGQ